MKLNLEKGDLWIPTLQIQRIEQIVFGTFDVDLHQIDVIDEGPRFKESANAHDVDRLPLRPRSVHRRAAAGNRHELLARCRSEAKGMNFDFGVLPETVFKNLGVAGHGFKDVNRRQALGEDVTRPLA